MTKFLSVTTAILFPFMLTAQSANVTWGDEFKMKRGSTDLEVIYVDKTGVYLKESHKAMKSYFVIGATLRESANLVKLDKSLSQEYSQNFNKELKGKEYERFFFLKDQLFIMASQYDKKNKKLTLHAAEVNKQDGELKSEWVEVTSWNLNEKSEDIQFNIAYSADSSNMVIVSSLEGKTKNKYEIRQFTNKMKEVRKPVVISNEFDPNTFSLEDVLYTPSGNIVLVGKIFEYEEGKKKKKKFLSFKNYNIRVHDTEGKLVKDVNTEIEGKWLMNTKVILTPGGDLALAAFYSNGKKGKEVNGMLVQRINPENGIVKTTSLKELNTALITPADDKDEEDDDDEEDRKERKENRRLEKLRDEEDGFSRFQRFRNIVFTPDNGIIILSEKFHHYTYTEFQSTGTTGGMRTVTYQVYECGNILMSKIDSAGNIAWLNVLPKEQKEMIRSGSSFGSGLNVSFGPSFFDFGFEYPFYAGFGVIPGAKTLTIIFNDHKKNEDVLQPGHRFRRINIFRKSVCYGVDLDMVTGTYTRKALFDNRDVPTAMPRHASALGKELYIVGKQDRIGKSKIAVARVKVK